MSAKPDSWSGNDGGTQRYGSTAPSGGGRIHFEENGENRERARLLDPRSAEDRASSVRRRSSIGAAMNTIAHAGGKNSIGNFARSWQRAAGFHEIAHSMESFAIASDENVVDDSLDVERTLRPRPSLLRNEIERPATPPEDAIHDIQSPDELHDAGLYFLGRSPSRGAFNSPFSSSFNGGTYGSVSSRDDVEQRKRATKAYLTRSSAERSSAPEKEREPLLIHEVQEPDGHISIQVIGQSTIYQTILNSTNVLIGVGILSLPLGIRYAGWVMGGIMLTLAAISTAYTARLLGKCLDIDRSMITYSDIALSAFGKTAEISIGLFFLFELTTAAVALVVLFGDSLHLLLPQFKHMEFEILCGLISLPLAFLPLRYLGITSMLGVVSCFSIVVLVCIAGIVKPDSPGSLLDPAATYLFPQDWSTLPLSLGLMMSPWGGHAVFPQFYRDMRHPHKYGKAVTATFSLTYVLDSAIAVIGLLMFGDATRAEITSNLFETKGYPRFISLLLIICIAVIPITKLPLNMQPIFSVIENILGIRGNYEEVVEVNSARKSERTRTILRVVVRVVVVAVITALGIVCPGFDRIMSFMGSLFCILICICFPVAFYLKLCSDEIGTARRVGLWCMGLAGVALAIIGTVWAFFPPTIIKT